MEDFVQRGVELVTFASATSHTLAVNFPAPFDNPPVVCVNIASGAGTIARWMARAISVTTSGFTLFLFVGDSGAPAAAWTDIPVHWVAVAP